MKRFLSILSLLLIIALAVPAFTACGEDDPVADDPAYDIPDDLWGVALRAKNPTATGLTLVVSQSGDGPTGELRTGSSCRLEQKIYGHWLSVDTIIDEDAGEEFFWPEENYVIPQGGSCSIPFDWSGLYGSLPAGEYRLAKAVTDYRGEGDYDAFTFYAEFEIK